jgi:hypothetical protein
VISNIKKSRLKEEDQKLQREEDAKGAKPEAAGAPAKPT